ncbi:MAG: protease modulator HflC [Phycisphaeraceae bacterium]|nr:protease modulator HflC [Phycisphaeraceae bacterium]
MKNRFVLLIGLIVVAVLLSYAFTFQVRYDQVAVRTTFGKADENSVVDEPGLYFRLPVPIQSVEIYDKRVRLLENVRQEQIQTADKQSVIVETYTTWRISDPLKFSQNLPAGTSPEETLETVVRDTSEVISKYEFDKLVNTDPEKIQLAKVEQEALAKMQADLKTKDYGIVIEAHGIRRIVLPQDVTEKVFEAMRQTRQRLAAETRESGQAEARRITSDAESLAKRIMAFAERRAEAIRARGDREASQYYDVFRENEDFAIFLRQVEALKEMLAHNTTFVLDAERISPLDLFKNGPQKK